MRNFTCFLSFFSRGFPTSFFSGSWRFPVQEGLEEGQLPLLAASDTSTAAGAGEELPLLRLWSGFLEYLQYLELFSSFSQFE